MVSSVNTSSITDLSKESSTFLLLVWLRTWVSISAESYGFAHSEQGCAPSISTFRDILQQLQSKTTEKHHVAWLPVVFCITYRWSIRKDSNTRPPSSQPVGTITDAWNIAVSTSHLPGTPIWYWSRYALRAKHEFRCRMV